MRGLIQLEEGIGIIKLLVWLKNLNNTEYETVKVSLKH